MTDEMTTPELPADIQLLIRDLQGTVKVRHDTSNKGEFCEHPACKLQRALTSLVASRIKDSERLENRVTLLENLLSTYRDHMDLGDFELMQADAEEVNRVLFPALLSGEASK